MLKRFLLLLVGCLTTLQVALAQSVSVNLSPPRIEAGQTTTLTVIVSDGQPRETPRVRAPDAVSMTFRGRQQSFTAGPRGITQTFRFQYAVQGLEEGEYELGPVKVELVSGKTLISKAIPLKVEERGTVERPKEELAVRTGFTETQIWEGQVVTYEAELTARLPVQDVGWRYPDFEGLQRAPHGEESRTRTTVGDPDGDITVIAASVPLVATGTGDRTQAPAVGRVSILQQGRGIFRRTRQRNVVGQRAPLTVRPLPEAPSDFSGLVGRFEVYSGLDKTDGIRVGQSVPWTVKVVGDGVVDGFKLEPPEIEGVEVYVDGDEVIGRASEGQYLAQKTFKMVLVPTQGGEIPIPSVPVVVFDTERGAYRTLEARAATLKVEGKAAKAEIQSFLEEGDEVEATPVDIQGLYTWAFATTPPLAPILPAFLALFGFPGMLLLLVDGGAAAARWAGDRFGGSDEGPTGLQRLRDLPTEPEEKLRVLDLALREALAERVNSPVGSLDRDAALATLERADTVRHAFQLLDAVRFAGAEPPADLLEKVRKALKELA